MMSIRKVLGKRADFFPGIRRDGKDVVEKEGCKADLVFREGGLCKYPRQHFEG
jgi:hypothetical protein